VEDLTNGEDHFPDTKALVKGTRSKLLPPVMTT
jgi:hypothetical protein